MIVVNSETTFVDWELTLWGEPVYDLVVHIHKMAYLPEEQAALITRWKAAMPADHITGWQQDLDSIRYAQLFAGNGPYPHPAHQLIETPDQQNSTRPASTGTSRALDTGTARRAISPR